MTDSYSAHRHSGNQPISFRQDLHDFLGRLGDDAVGMADWQNAALAGVATAGAIAIHQDWDDDVREYTAEHPKRWGHGSTVIGYFGHAEYHVPALLGLYGWSVKQQDPELHEYATTLISAYTLTSISVLSLKLITDTDRPSDEWNDGRYGFPSYHGASLFTLAAVTEEFHGFLPATPLYTLAGLVSWSRIDERDHDLSDVVFGAFLGWAVGKSVAATRLHGDGRIRLRPYFHPTEPAAGLAVQVPF
ncbi:phosphatase PAP2 family protein [Thalassoroseus pseudoceratinae]|uniref:phosphatase PAP2 family protein n=1 Tax=Thalassoroseus pseudoceratinae TaxID=2713176 RepID=UPI00141FA3F3|nr:phosphatase PAP2 family protein [Thalassoroseus pseudoceratinae]